MTPSPPCRLSSGTYRTWSGRRAARSAAPTTCSFAGTRGGRRIGRRRVGTTCRCSTTESGPRRRRSTFTTTVGAASSIGPPPCAPLCLPVRKERSDGESRRGDSDAARGPVHPARNAARIHVGARVDGLVRGTRIFRLAR